MFKLPIQVESIFTLADGVRNIMAVVTEEKTLGIIHKINFEWKQRMPGRTCCYRFLFEQIITTSVKQPVLKQ